MATVTIMIPPNGWQSHRLSPGTLAPAARP